MFSRKDLNQVFCLSKRKKEFQANKLCTFSTEKNYKEIIRILCGIKYKTVLPKLYVFLCVKKVWFHTNNITENINSLSTLIYRNNN